MGRQNACARHGLAEEKIEEGIGLARGGVKHVHRRQGAAAGPSIGSDPPRLGAGSGSTQLRRQGLAVCGHSVVAHILQTDSAAIQIQGAAVTVIHRRGNVRRQLALQHQPHAASFEIPALVGECSRIHIGQHFSVEGGDVPNSGESGISETIAIERHLHAGIAFAMRQRDFLVFRLFKRRREPSHADAWVGFAHICRR